MPTSASESGIRSRTEPGAIIIPLKRAGSVTPTHIRISSSEENLEVTLKGLRYSKENLIAVAQSWIETGRADEYVSTRPEPMEYDPIAPFLRKATPV